MKKQYLQLIFTATIFLFVPALQAQTVVPGSLPGELSVSPTGAAVYTIPIELPEGRGGMTPQLSLQYNSSAGDGILGKGWGLSGWSYISRVAESQYYDGTVGSVDFINDGYALDGMRLINIPNSNIYRTEIDEVSRITANGFGKDERRSNTYFVVETKSGYKKYYGATDGSASRQFYGIYDAHPVRWHLDKVVDLSGNMILYYYERDPNYGEIYLRKIEYSKNDAAGAINSQFYTVEFEYKNITNNAFHLSTFLSHGENAYRYDVRKRLIAINVKYGTSDLIRKYFIDYTTGGVHGNEYLSEVKLVSGDESICYNPTTFVWNYNIADDAAAKQILIEDNIPFPGYPKLKITADVNGDGRADIIEASPGGNTLKALINNGQNNVTVYELDNFSPTKLLSGDFDGDGKDEILAENASGQVGLYKLYTHGFVKIGSYLTGTISFVGDFDGDGFYDVITKEGEMRKYCAGSSNIYNLLNISNRKTLEGVGNFEYRLGYFTGSSRMGIMKRDGYTLTHYIVIPNSETTYSLLPTFSFSFSIAPYLYDFGDFNGDGKDDLIALYWDGSDYTTEIHYSYGNGFTSIGYNMSYNAYWGNNYRLIDLNNDGFSDIVFISDGSVLN